MKKIDVVEKLAQIREISKKEAGEIVDTFIDIVKTGIKEDGEVDFYGFVKFTKVHKEAGTARSPKTGETEASKSPKFKAGKALKDAVKNA